MDASKVRFTKHAEQKFDLLKKYGFEITKEKVIRTVLKPKRLDKKANQCFAVAILDSKYGLRVVYEERKAYKVIITFYPVRRERYGI